MIASRTNASIRVQIAMTHIRKKSPLDDPLKQFLEGSGEYFEHAYDEAGACHNRCYIALQSDLEAAGSDADKIQKAHADNQTCINECPPLVPPFQL